MSVYQRASGIYRIDLNYRDPITGQTLRYRGSSGTRSKREALALEQRWRTELESPQQSTAPSGRAAFSGFAKRWLDTHIRTNCKPSYVRSTEQILRVHLVPYFGDRDLRSITVEMVETFKAAQVRTGASPKSVNNRLGVLGSMFTKAVEWRYADANPMAGVRPLAVPDPTFQFWTTEQSEAFLAAVRRVRAPWYPFFLCLLRTGMRLGEVAALTWGDVDFVRGEILVRRSWSHGHLTTPKGGRNRILDMSPELAQALQDHRHLRGDLVFCAADGGYLDRNKVKHPFWASIKAAGVPKIRIHDLRHSFASQLVVAGAPLKAVQELLGHVDIQMTMRYAHLAPQVKRDYVRLLNGHGGAKKNAQGG